MFTGIADRCPLLGFILIRNLNLHCVHSVVVIALWSYLLQITGYFQIPENILYSSKYSRIIREYFLQIRFMKHHDLFITKKLFSIFFYKNILLCPITKFSYETNDVNLRILCTVHGIIAIL